MKLFLKGERCHTEKCAVEKRNFVPGQHGKDRKAKIVGYGLQLREKQKARRYYQVLEGQFRNLFEKASAMKGITGENMLSMLERRLDNVVYRMGFGTSRSQSRQLVRHGHIDVNGKRVNIPSFRVKKGQVISLSPKAQKMIQIQHNIDTLDRVRAAGINVCSGGIVGMGETRADRVGFVHALATMDHHPESVPVNALVPVKGTVLGDMLKRLRDPEVQSRMADPAGPMPWMYCNPMMTRFCVGMFTPAIRATSRSPKPRAGLTR